MKLAFTTLACPDWDLQTIIAQARKSQYDGVDFRGYLGEPNIYKRPEFSAQLSETVRRFADAGLQISALSSGARAFEPDRSKRAAFIEEVSAYAELCQPFGTKFIRVFGGPLEGTKPTEALKAASETLDEMARAAEPICVLLETHDDWVDSALVSKLFENTSAENVGVLWDIHHPYRLNNEDASETFDNIGRLVRYLHVKDSRPKADGTYEYTLGGEGDVPIAQIIGLLKSAGYDGWVTVEWEKRWHPELAEPETALPAYAEYLRKII